MLYIVFVLLLCIVVGAASYAYIVARTNEGNVNNNSGKMDVDYTITENITGIQLMPSEDKSGGLHSVATAKINSGSLPSAFNIYITPTSIAGLNIAALNGKLLVLIMVLLYIVIMVILVQQLKILLLQ